MSPASHERRNIIGERVKEARQRRHPPLTQNQLSGQLAARGLQLDRVAIAKIETGLRSAFDFEVKALAAALQVDANWLLGIQTDRQSKSRTVEARASKG
ncbi:MAG: XRE family transcriptional regulator [Acidobacteriota bacterium]|nr:XRE family transcriptional regulator [Acidobacteriota bacterium]